MKKPGYPNFVEEDIHVEDAYHGEKMYLMEEVDAWTAEHAKEHIEVVEAMYDEVTLGYRAYYILMCENQKLNERLSHSSFTKVSDRLRAANDENQKLREEVEWLREKNESLRNGLDQMCGALDD